MQIGVDRGRQTAVLGNYGSRFLLIHVDVVTHQDSMTRKGGVPLGNFLYPGAFCPRSEFRLAVGAVRDPDNCDVVHQQPFTS